MPPVQIPAEDVLAYEDGPYAGNAGKGHDSTAGLLRLERKAAKPPRAADEAPRAPARAAPEPPASGPAAAEPRTILDPKFSRALDFKLRRLKEREILQAKARRAPRGPRDGPLAASNPNISLEEPPTDRKLSRSQPQIHVAPPESENDGGSSGLEPPTSERRGRGRNVSEGERPRFITTVKTGRFLLPPPELARLLGLDSLYPPQTQEREKLVYSYSSKPKAVVSRAKRTPPERKEAEAGGGGAGRLFRGVRALAAGVAGMARSLHAPHNGSVATAVTAATAATAATAQHANVMHDKRVVRGSVFAAHAHAAGDGAESAAARAARTRRRALARRAAAARLRPGTPPPAPGRRHHPVQTDLYLEELFDRGVEMEVGVQTDLFVDRPPTPAYVPAKTGADAGTQICPGDLFDFNLEVQPILEVLVGKTAEQALAEVAQEEELAALREQQRRFRELRDAELAERQRLAAHDVRLHHERARRVAQARDAQVAAREARERAAAAGLVQGFVAELVPAVLAGLRDQGYLLERMRRGVDEEFLPWLVQEVARELEAIITSRDVVTEIVREVVEARAELYRGAGERDTQATSPAESVTPPSAPGEADEEPDE